MILITDNNPRHCDESPTFQGVEEAISFLTRDRFVPREDGFNIYCYLNCGVL
jgi:hypothetical protein